MRQVFHRLLAGDSEKQVAAPLGISSSTVHFHVKSLYRRLEFSGRAEFMALAFRPAAVSIPPSRPRVLRHNIGLTESQREELPRFLSADVGASARRTVRAKILLRLDGRCNDYDIADELNISIRTVERSRQSFRRQHLPAACHA